MLEQYKLHKLSVHFMLNDLHLLAACSTALQWLLALAGFHLFSFALFCVYSSPVPPTTSPPPAITTTTPSPPICALTNTSGRSRAQISHFLQTYIQTSCLVRDSTFDISGPVRIRHIVHTKLLPASHSVHS